MDGERWQRIREVFEAALERGAGQRAAFLDQACTGDEPLRREVESLIEADASGGTLFDKPLVPMAGAATPSESMVGRTHGQYEVLEELGRGGMGVVYKARDRQLGRLVALKFLPDHLSGDHSRERLLQEARAASALDHPNICTIYELGETGAGELFIAMAYYDGETLNHRIARGPLPPEEVLELAVQIGDGLARAHARGIVHRDVKPANVMVTREGRVKLLDFGLAKLRGATPITREGAVIGTPHYMSPEQLRGEALDGRTDVWSLGVVLYEALTASLPFEAESGPALFNVILSRRPKRLRELRPGVPEALAAAIEKALSKPRDQRYPRMEDMLSDLRALPSSPPTSSASAPIGGASRTSPAGSGGRTRRLGRAPGSGPSSAEPSGGTVRQRGRDAELGRLMELFDRASAGERQTVFVCGEAGLGKTTLVEAFLRRAGESGGLWHAVGQCLDHQGPGEAYLPVLEALERLGRGSRGGGVLEALETHAPSWLAHLPSLAADADSGALRSRPQGVGRDRLLREMVGALEHLSREAPLVLVLEDLHWADASTVDLVHRLQLRSEPARLMVLATLRADDAERSESPVAATLRDLTLRRGAARLDLELLDQEAVAALVGDELRGGVVPAEVTRLLRRRAGGHPLFVLSTLRAWVEEGRIEQAADGTWAPTCPLAELEAEVPGTLAEIIEQRFVGVDPATRRVLDAASVAGAEFAAATVAAATGLEHEAVEARCEALAGRGGFLEEAGLDSWPDGTVTPRFAFHHDLYREVLYRRLASGRRLRLHRRVGERLEAGAGEHAAARAGELAFHFCRGLDAPRASRYSLAAAERALKRFAYREALTHACHGLELVGQVGEPDRARLELGLETGFAAASMALEGYAAPAVVAACHRAKELAEALGESRALGPILTGLCRHYVLAGELGSALDVGEQLLSLAADTGDRNFLIEGHVCIAVPALYLGQLERCLKSAQTVFDAVLPPGAERPLSRRALEGFVLTKSFWAWARYLCGWPEQALAATRETVERARALGPSFELALAYHQHGWLLLFEQRREELAETARTLLSLSEEQGFRQWTGAARCLLGWVQVGAGEVEAGLACLREGVAAWQAAPSRLASCYSHLLAEALEAADREEEALRVLEAADALAGDIGERWYGAPLATARGELLLAQGRAEEGDAWLERAVRRAREIGARTFELRALESRSRRLQRLGRAEEVRPEAEALAAALEAAEARPRDRARRLLAALG